MKLLPLASIPLLALTACAGNPVNAVPVSAFETDRYLGTWYEVARLDHTFERGLSNVTANYTKREDGKITVLNRGYNEKKGEFEDAKGKAKYANDPSIGHLKVSFFGPFYGDYIIFDLERTDYTTAYVSGGKDNYLWLLSRTPTVSAATRAGFLSKSQALGYDTDSLIWVDQTRSN
jgi:apolipoprotein D and lipocalin family protein